MGSWSLHQELSQRSIQWQELFTILAAAKVWGPHQAGRRVRFHCNNQTIVYAWSGQSSDVTKLLRELFFITAHHDFAVQLVHITSQHNALSCNMLPHIFSLALQANQ